jgi:sortase A
MGVVAVDYLDRAWYQVRQEQRLLREIPLAFEGAPFRGIDDVAEPVKPPSKPLEWALATRSEAAMSGLVGQIRIDRLGLSAMVAEGEDSRTLKHAVGHLPDTAFPGEKGNVVLAGHRDTFFRDLKDVRESDEIDIITPDGTFKYLVVETMIVSPEQVEVLESDGESILTLVTCYPFSYVGNAPKRFIVRAQQIFSAPPGDQQFPDPIEPERLLRA